MATTEKKTPVRRKKTSTKATTVKEAKTKVQAKVDELLEGVTINKKKEEKVVDKLEEATKEKNIGWMENQLTALTTKIEQLEIENQKLLSENQVLRGKSGEPKKELSMPNDSLKKGVEKMFFELDDVFTGAKFGTSYKEAKIKPLLDKFVNNFPFLIDSLKKRKTFASKAKA